MAKQKFKITNWSTYNKALKQRGSLTIWLDESAIAAWTEKTTPERRGRPLHYSDMAITTVLMMKRVFGLSLRALQGFVDSIFKLMGLPLRCPDYSLISKRAKTVKISIKTPTRGEISHLVIDGTGLKVFGEGEWKVRQHGAERRRVWRKLHLAVDIVKRLNFDYIINMSYSLDFRRKVLAIKKEKGLSIRETAKRFCIGSATVSRWIKQIEPKPAASRSRKIDKSALEKDVREYPDAYQRERAIRFGVCQKAIWQALKKLAITYKKKHSAILKQMKIYGNCFIKK